MSSREVEMIKKLYTSLPIDAITIVSDKISRSDFPEECPLQLRFLDPGVNMDYDSSYKLAKTMVLCSDVSMADRAWFYFHYLLGGLYSIEHGDDGKLELSEMRALKSFKQLLRECAIANGENEKGIL